MRRALLACIGFGLAALIAPTLLHVQARVVYNPSDSVARGWYRIDPIAKPDLLHVGSIVLARLPDSVAAFAAQRSYLPDGVPVLKRIGALAPQSVCIREQVVRIDRDPVAITRLHDGAHRPLSAWTQCRPLVGDELFLLSNTNPASFDSRYFGPIDASAVLGIARPLWTWGAR
ncbi:MAG: S26 family signal peptidase [Variovorax sp.]